jgi:hypothetical protein
MGRRVKRKRRIGRSLKHKKLQEMRPGQWNVRADTGSVKRVLSNPLLKTRSVNYTL